MRKTTLAGLSIALSYAILLVMQLAGFSVPLVLSPLVVGLAFAPILMLPLTLLNRHLLVWRKTRGRDIEEEEKYEHDGVISLRARE